MPVRANDESNLIMVARARMMAAIVQMTYHSRMEMSFRIVASRPNERRRRNRR